MSSSAFSRLFTPPVRTDFQKRDSQDGQKADKKPDGGDETGIESVPET
jgi:hypothetical protein